MGSGTGGLNRKYGPLTTSLATQPSENSYTTPLLQTAKASTALLPSWAPHRNPSAISTTQRPSKQPRTCSTDSSSDFGRSSRSDGSSCSESISDRRESRSFKNRSCNKWDEADTTPEGAATVAAPRLPWLLQRLDSSTTLMVHATVLRADQRSDRAAAALSKDQRPNETVV